MINSKELIPSEKIVPEVVDESGKKVIRPDILQMVTQLASLGQLARIRKSLEKEDFEGKLDPRTLDATDELQWLDLVQDHPFKPWVSAYFVNNGDDSVYIMINDSREKRHKINKNETLTLDHSHADERIERIFYVCDAGETASVRVTGQW